MASWVVVALLLRISDQARRPLPALEPVDEQAEANEATQLIKVAR